MEEDEDEEDDLVELPYFKKIYVSKMVIKIFCWDIIHHLNLAVIDC